MAMVNIFMLKALLYKHKIKRLALKEQQQRKKRVLWEQDFRSKIRIMCFMSRKNIEPYEKTPTLPFGNMM